MPHDTEDTHQAIAHPRQHVAADGPVHESSPAQSGAALGGPGEESQRARGAPAAHEKPFVWTMPTVRTVVDQILASLLAGTLSLGGQRISTMTIIEETVDTLVVQLQMAAGGSRLMSFALHPLPSPIRGFPVDSAPLDPLRAERDWPTQEQRAGVVGADDADDADDAVGGDATGDDQ